MLLQIPDVLSPSALDRIRAILDAAPWTDGRSTAGPQSAQVKRNLQLADSSDAAKEAGKLVLEALAANGRFFASVLPKRISPPLFNRYTGDANTYGDHVDNALRLARDGGRSLRADVSATLFLSDPADYDGGELVIDSSFGVQRIKLPPGHLIVYPASSVHRVEPVTRGARSAAVFWTESMVRDNEQRRLLFELDSALVKLRADKIDPATSVRLTGCYHNLLRMWADT